jgi:spore germination protein PC
MYNDIFHIYQYLQQLDQYVRTQQQEIERLEKVIQSLQIEMKELKTKPYTNIEKVEYKFDQLKVETLEGTLNIGLNPYNGEQVEDFAVNQGKLNVPSSQPVPSEMQEYIRRSIDDYLNQEGHDLIRKVQERNGVPYNDSYYNFMIQDVNRQLDGRILYYLEQVGGYQNWNDEGKAKEIADHVIQKLKLDIENAFTSFVQHLPNDWKGDER